MKINCTSGSLLVIRTNRGYFANINFYEGIIESSGLMILDKFE